jgi:sugar phosphate isomerase/epimerase
VTNDVGVMASVKADGSTLKYVADFGLAVCQVVGWQEELLTDEMAERLKVDSAELGVQVTSMWAGWPGPKVWDFLDGPATLGLVPAEYRAERVECLKHAARFAHRADLPAIVTHLGFIPENPRDPVFAEVVDAVRDIAELLATMDMAFWFETGQETPVTMLRLIEEVGTGNLGVNLDPANLILYGKASPIDSLDVFGQYVRSIHAKDGLYPTDPMKLGREVKVGEGRVRFPEFVKHLAAIGYDGAYIIEREISGPEQSKDIAATVQYLRRLLQET